MADSLHQLYTELFQAVMEDDLKSQLYYLSAVEEQRKIPVDYLLSLGALFIPNAEYIEHYLGGRARESVAGLYYGEQCPWVMFVLLPIRDLSGEVRGIVGWDAYNKYKELSEGAQGLVSYRVSAKSVFARERFFLSDVECLKSQFSKRTIFITDGVFDAVSLDYRKVPAIALLGSSFSQEILYFLGWYRQVYVCADNDNAGQALYRKLARALPNVHRVIQPMTKDVEELLRADGVDGPISTQFLNVRDSAPNTDVYLEVNTRW